MKLFAALVFFVSLMSNSSVFAQSSTTVLPKRTNPRPARPSPQIRDALAEDDETDEEAGESEKSWSATFQSFNEMSAVSLNTRNFNESNAGTDALMTNFVGLEYKLNHQISAGAAQEWENTWGLGDHKSGNRLLDTYFQLKHEELFRLDSRTHSEAHARLYLPTGQESRELEQIAHVRFEATLQRDIRRLTVRYVLRPEYHFQKYLAYLDVATDEVKGTPSLELWNLAEFEYRVSEKLKVRQTLGLADSWFHGDSEYQLANSRSEDFISETGLNWEAADYLTLEGGIYQWAPNLLDQNRALSLYRDDEANYYFYAEVAF